MTVNTPCFSDRLMTAALEFFGGKLPPRRKFNLWADSFCRALPDHTGVRLDGYQLEAVLLAYAHGIQTGRLCGQACQYLQGLSTRQLLTHAGQMVDSNPLSCLDDYYQAWRVLALRGAKIPA